MGEIKFRAWCKDTKRMMYRGLFDRNWYTESKIISGKRIDCIDPSDAHTKEVMQYTGLKDKNGVEIYEGDIVKIVEYCNHIGKVYYSYNQFTVEDFDTGDYYYGSDAFRWDWHRFEVIGNIYENPELLED